MTPLSAFIIGLIVAGIVVTATVLMGKVLAIFATAFVFGAVISIAEGNHK